IRRKEGRQGKNGRVEGPYEDRLELAGPGSAHEAVERWPALLRPRESAIDELLEDRPAALSRVGAQRGKLDLRGLLAGRHASAEGDVHGHPSADSCDSGAS